MSKKSVEIVLEDAGRMASGLRLLTQGIEGLSGSMERLDHVLRQAASPAVDSLGGEMDALSHRLGQVGRQLGDGAAGGAFAPDYGRIAPSGAAADSLPGAERDTRGQGSRDNAGGSGAVMNVTIAPSISIASSNSPGDGRIAARIDRELAELWRSNRSELRRVMAL